MKTTSILFICILLSASCITINAKDRRSNKGYEIKGDKNIISCEFNIDDYTSMHLSGAVEVEYEQNPTKPPYLRVEMDKNLIDFVKVEVKGKNLTVNSTKNIRPTRYKVYTNSRKIDRIKCSGAVKLTTKGKTQGKKLELKSSGATKLNINEIEFNEIIVNTSGASNLYLSGTATNISINSSGAGKIKAYDLTAKNAACNISGAGDVRISVTERIDGKISGAGNLSYKGNPLVKVNASRAAKVRKAG